MNKLLSPISAHCQTAEPPGFAPVEQNTRWNKLFVSTGLGTNTTTHTEVFDLTHTDAECGAIPAYPIELYGAEMGVIGDEPVMCGGVHFNDVTDKCYAYSHLDQAWYLFGNMFRPRRYYGMLTTTVLSGDEPELWITGGESNPPFVYDSTEVVSSTGIRVGPNLALGVVGHCMVEFKGQVFVIGGLRNGYPFATATDSVFVFHPSNDTFTLHSHLNVARYGTMCGVAKGSDGREQIVVAGGSKTSINLLDSVEIWTDGESAWDIDTTSLPQVLDGGAAVQYGDTFLIVSGSYGTSDRTDAVLQFNPDLKSFEEIFKLARSRAEPAAALVPDNVVPC
eukprot:snap_masked-scaffold424_size175595-processed-gene-0.3 protein:Tk01540 transcript:snap_masked-scaffold424_size175595-processed-gene-0.3-mRNA-1 annotation:"hypothetical protein"